MHLSSSRASRRPSSRPGTVGTLGSRGTSGTLGALGVLAVAALALSACAPVSPSKIASPTPAGSHLATPYVPAAETAAPSSSAGPTASASPSAAPSVTPSTSPTAAPSASSSTKPALVKPAVGAVHTAVGLEWADGTAVSATTVALPSEPRPQGAAKHTLLWPTGEMLEGASLSAVTSDGHAVAVIKDNLVTVGKDGTSAPAVSGAVAGKVDGTPLARGKGIVWTDTIRRSGKTVSRVLSVAAVGGTPKVVAELPNVKRPAESYWDAVRVFEDESGAASVLLAAPTETDTSDFYRVSLAGGPATLVLKDAEDVWDTPKGTFAKRTQADGTGVFGSVKRGVITPIMRTTDPDIGGLPDSTDGTSAVVLFPTLPGIAESDQDQSPVSMVIDLGSKRGLAVDRRLPGQGDGTNAIGNEAVGGTLVTFDATRLYLSTPAGVAVRSKIDLENGLGMTTSLWMRDGQLGMTGQDITQDLAVVFDVGR